MRGGMDGDLPAAAVYVPKQYKSSYPSSTSYGAPKGAVSIGGVPFKALAGQYLLVQAHLDFLRCIFDHQTVHNFVFLY